MSATSIHKAFPFVIGLLISLCISFSIEAQVNILAQDFETVSAPNLPAGWTTENPNGGFVFMTGDSTAANSGGFWAIDPHGQFAFASDDACNCNMSEVRLILPPLDLTNFEDVTLSAEVWLDNVYGSAPFEFGRIEVSIDNGTNWTAIGGNFPPIDAWQTINVDLSLYDGTPNLLVAFRFNDNTNWGRGLAVDDVVVQGLPPGSSTCFFEEKFQAVTAPALPGGWTTENPNGGFVFMTGDSTAANSGGFWAIDPHGQFAFASDDACNCDMSEVRLILPPQDFSNYISVSLEADIWLDNVYGGDPFETGRIEISTDNGVSWNAVGADFSPIDAWQTINIDLSAYDGLNNVLVAFRFDDNGNWGRGLAVDDVCLSGISLLECFFIEDFQSVSAPALPGGWTTENPSGGFTFMTGDSTAANSGGFWAIDPNGQFAFASDDACNCDMSEVRLILPPQNFDGFTNVILSADVWLDNVYGSEPFETARIEASVDNGSTWIPVGMDFSPLEAWQSIMVDLSTYDGMDNVLIAFRFDDNTNWGRGLAVDDVCLAGISGVTCETNETFNEVSAPDLPAGWTTSNPNGGFVFMTGDSTAANSGGFWSIDPHGQFAFASDDACNCNMSEVRLILPPQDLTGLTNAELRAEVWLDNVYGSAPFETARVEISLDNGISWSPVGPDFPPLEAWQIISRDLTPWIGMSNVWLAFRYDDNGNWGRGLAVDNARVCTQGPSVDAAIMEVMRINPNYNIVPLAHETVTVLKARVENLGSADLTNVVLTTIVYEESNLSNPVYTLTTAPQDLAPGASVVLDNNPGNGPLSAAGRWLAFHSVSHDDSGSDSNTSNNSMWTPVYELSYDVFARDDRNSAEQGPFGIGGGLDDNGIIGQTFKFETNDHIGAVEVVLDSPDPGMSVTVALYGCTASGKPTGSALAITETQFSTGGGADETFLLSFPAPISVNPGYYYFGVLEPAESIGLKGWSSIYQAPEGGFEGSNWVRWDGVSDWTETASLNPSYAAAYAIRPHLTEVVSVGSIPSFQNLLIYPNPTSDLLYVELELDEAMEVRLEIFSATGQLIRATSSEIGANMSYELSFGDEPAGLYLARLLIDGEEVSKRFVISR
ncbi:MAG: T9SS type A sorting domain-containing protein [Bacteroidota bacterium]